MAIICILLQSCLPEAQNKSLTYQNIIIISDLSDRIKPFINGNTHNQQYPPKDIEEIHKLLKFFTEECVKPGEKIGDRSSISFTTFSDEASVSIDLGRFKDLGERQQFVNSTGEYKGTGLDYEIEAFKRQVSELYDSVQNSGLDLISGMIEKIENKSQSIIHTNTFLSNGKDTTFVNYDNHIYLFTDGYLEYKGKKSNDQFYFGRPEIEKIRRYCEANKVSIKSALENHRSLSLPPVRNDLNKLIYLHVLETHERDKDTKLQTYKNPVGLRDNEILEAVWRQWANDSGFKDFEWRKF